MATTKTKKILTPIDEHETFVSLQKSFAETEQTVREKLKTLYELQVADNEIDKLVQLRGELPEEVSALESDLDGIKSKITRIEGLVSEYLHTIESKNAEIIDIDAEIMKYQKQLENISNSREYDSINKELENLNLLRQIAEKNIREARERIEDCKKNISSLGDTVAVREGDLEAKREELALIVDSTATEEAALRERRDACAAKIDERTMSAYNRIRSNYHNHLAVVPVYNGDSCGGCFSTITPQRLIDIASGKLVICEHCNRIIVSAE